MSASRSYSPPLDPILRRLPLEVGRTFPARKIRSAWVRFLPGHWALGLWKIGVGAVPLLRLPFPNQRPEAVFRRRGAQCAPAGWSGTGPYAETDAFPILRRGGCPHPPAAGSDPPVGAAISRPKRPDGDIGPYKRANTFSDTPQGRPHAAARPRGLSCGAGVCPRRRQGVCPSRPAPGTVHSRPVGVLQPRKLVKNF